MAEIEKKYSDYQESECKTEQQIEVVDEKICPTCEEDPNFKLRAEWFEIEESYLNKAVCEYHVRVYEREAQEESEDVFFDIKENVIKVGVLKILNEFNKPINDGTKKTLENAAEVVDLYRSATNDQNGVAYLVAVPAFNLDQVLPNSDPKSTENDNPNFKPLNDHIIVQSEKLGRKLKIIELTIITYGAYYSMAQKASDSFSIRQEEDIVKRINYPMTARRVNKFVEALGDALETKDYPRVDELGFFKSKRTERIKFTFKDSNTPYEFDELWVMSKECPDKYDKIEVGENSYLRDPALPVVYHFLSNLDRVYNDIVAKETKPWLEWTLDHFYPQYIVDRGNIEDLQEARVGLECLLEDQLGLKGSNVADSLANEIMSAFDYFEMNHNKYACREIEKLQEGGSSQPGGEGDIVLAAQDRKDKMLVRYQKEFENKFYDFAIPDLKKKLESPGLLSQSLSLQERDIETYQGTPASTVSDPGEVTPYSKKIDKSNFFTILRKESEVIFFNIPEYKFKNNDGEKVTGGGDLIAVSNAGDLKSAAKNYALTKFTNLESDPGSISSQFGWDQINNSPHMHDAKLAVNEVFNDDNTFLTALKETYSGKDLSRYDFIPTIGLCGMSKLAGKALDCIANGISFDSFLDILIDKTFDYMEVNTLHLFLNDLPAPFRAKLSETIEREFGPNVDLNSLFGIKMANGGNEKLKDFAKSKTSAKRIKKLFEKYRKPWLEGTDLEKELIFLSVTTDIPTLEDIERAIDSVGFDREKKHYPKDKVTRPAFTVKGQTGQVGGMKEFKRSDWVLKYIKFVMRGYKIVASDFIAATIRIKNATSEKYQETFRTDERRQIRQQIKENDEYLEQLKREYSQLMEDSIAYTDIPMLGPYAPEYRERAKRIGRRAGAIRRAQAELYEQLEEISLANLAKQEADRIEAEVVAKIELLESSYEDFVAQIGPATEQAALYISQEIDAYFNDFFGTLASRLDNVADDIIITGSELNEFENAQKSFEETALGVKVDIVFDLVFDYLVDAIVEEFAIDDLFAMIKSYPAVDLGLDALEAILLPSCPQSPVIYPPPGDFLKSLKVDVCDPTFSLTLPKINIPSIDWRFQIQKQFTEILREAVIKLATEIVVSMIARFMNTLEGALCNVVESAGGFVANGLTGQGFTDSLVNALNEAFCNDQDDPQTARKKAEQLADALFYDANFDPSMDPTGSGNKVANIIGSVSSTNEVLGAMVSRDGEENDQFNQRVANAVNLMAPEMRSLLGSPDQVAYFFSNLGSHLSPEDRERIRNLLDADIPNLPISQAICLTNEELEDWNNFRNNLLREQGLSPEEAQAWVDNLNEKAEDALSRLMDDVATLQQDGGSGPLDEAVSNELLKDSCNPNNVINPSNPDPVTSAIENDLIEAFYGNISKSLVKGFTGRNGILGEAMRDFDGRREFSRGFLKIFNPNVQNSQTERTAIREEKSKFGGIIMDILTEDDNVISQYPKTVGIIQREKILEDDGKQYDFSYEGKTVNYKFYDSTEGFLGFGDQSYTQNVTARNNRKNKQTFDYTFELSEKINEQPDVIELKFEVPVSVSDQENSLMENYGIQYQSNDSEDLRKTLFHTFVRGNIPLPGMNYGNLYEKAFESFNKNLVELLMTDSKQSDGIPNGYRFGYVNEDITPASFMYYNPDGSTPYNKDESEKILGKFGSPRIIPLNPALYGGRYSNPPYYVEPRSFSGWMELATKAFESTSGCDPKAPPLISFDDIKTRTKDLGQSLREDPRLERSPECVSEKPFHLLLDKKQKSKLDGVVRTTLRTYIIEYFFKGYGLFSNLQVNADNFDQGLFLYITNKIKSEMYDLGFSFSSNRVTIVKEKYWYTFLEQCVEAYQRMIDVDGINPPENVMSALNSIQRGLDLYRPVDIEIQNKMVEKIKSSSVAKPDRNYNPEQVMKDTDVVNLCLQSVAFRLTTDEEEKRDFFNGEDFDDIGSLDIQFASQKKLRFFQKIYFIALFEREAIIVMSELLRSEFNRLNNIVVDGLKDKPHYSDLSKSLFGMTALSTSRVGTNEFYIEKQTQGQADPGQVPEIPSDSSSPTIETTDEPQFIIESYGRFVNREDPSLSPIIRNRPQKYVGAIPLSNMAEFVSQNLSLFQDNYLSDFFGDLSFLYEGSFRQLLEKGFTDSISLARLLGLNRDDGITVSQLQNARNRFLGSLSFEDFIVKYDDFFITDSDNPEPIGTTGTTGVKYGLRISLVFPKDYFSSDQASFLSSNPDFNSLSKNEKAYLFDDGSFVLPLVSQEIDVIDSKFSEFNPFSGIERYDLECLINKMVDQPAFKLMMDKIFNMRQCSTMLSVYCMETLMPSLGRKVAPEDSNDSDNFERSNGKESDPEDDWDGTINKSGKNFLRREFKSLYLSRTIDGLDTNPDDEEGLRLRGLFSLGNPFDFLLMPSVRLPWWIRRKMKTKIYDANGMECVDPKKDLQ